MATNTANYALRKPDPTDTVNVATDLDANYDILDTNLKRVDDASLASTSPNRWVRSVSSPGAYLGTSGNTELELPKLGVNNINVVTGQLYNFSGKLTGLNPTVNGDAYHVRIRTGTVFAGAAERVFVPTIIISSSFTHALPIVGYWKATVTATLNFYVSVQRAAGSGGISIEGDNTSFFKMWLDPTGSTDYVES